MSATDVTGIGRSADRIEGREKVSGAARYAYEYDHPSVAYASLVQSTVARGRVDSVDLDRACSAPVLAVLWHGNAPRLVDTDGELAVLQSDRVAYRGQIVAIVVAVSQEQADEAAGLVRIGYRVEPARVELDPEDPQLFTPDKVNPNFPTDTIDGDVEGAMAAARYTVDHTYRTPAQHNNPMEPHAAMAVWEGRRLTLYDSTQGVIGVRDTLAAAFGLEPDDVRVISPHVGGGFGSKGTPRPHVIAAAMAASVAGRPVKIAVTRRQMFAFVGYRTPTIQRIRLGCDGDGHLTAIAHDVVEQTSTLKEFAEQTAVATRMMYAAPNRRTSHRLAALDMPTPSWMRAPGECPGMYALESAIDELALEAELDPVELRIRNEPDVDPGSGLPFSSRGLVDCLRKGAARFDWDALRARRAVPGDRYLTGVGVAASTYPSRWRPSQARVRRCPNGSHPGGGRPARRGDRGGAVDAW
jgi:xanthine dehydrogenase YagR molybdenum-binding subunit